jgi:hypothetical protein
MPSMAVFISRVMGAEEDGPTPVTEGKKQEEAKRYRFPCIGGGQRDSSSGARQNPVRRQRSEGDFRCLCFRSRKA